MRIGFTGARGASPDNSSRGESAAAGSIAVTSGAQ